MGHLNSDTLPELIIGNYSGGVSLFLGDLVNGLNETAIVDFEFGIYPNPAKNNFTLTNSLSPKELPAVFTIMNMEGQVMLQKQVTGERGQIDVPGFAAGIYICSLQGKSGIISHRKLVLGN
jgi:hypothetical protein